MELVEQDRLYENISNYLLISMVDSVDIIRNDSKLFADYGPNYKVQC